MSEKDPEYQKAYDAEMAKLNGEAEAAGATTTEPEKKEPEQEPQVAQTIEQEVDAKRLAEELEKAKKALADTQRWGHNNAAEIKRIKQELDEERRAKSRPEILDQNPGLEDAIKHVAGSPATKVDPQQNWITTVAKALPDIDSLLADQDFHAKAAAKRQELGPTWEDPIVATRELAELRTAHIRDKAVASAVEAARKDFESKQKKSTAMQVPGGGSSSKASTEVDEAQRIREMSKDDFAKMRSKALGYN